MAIQITDKLIEDINAHIKELCKTAIKSEFGSSNEHIPIYICHEDKDFADKVYWGDKVNLRDQMPDKWCSNIKCSPSNSYGYSELRIKNEAYPKIPLRFSIDTKGLTYKAPPNTNQWDDKLTLYKTLSDKSPMPTYVFEQLKARCEVATRWEETGKKVKEFLQTCRSLNQAVKVWPELVNFLPEDRRKRLEEDNKPKAKKERTTPAPEEILGQINRDEIAADLVALRFATN
jgi:hypothetical protein